MSAIESDRRVAVGSRLARPSTTQATDALLVVSVLLLPVYPWISVSWPTWAPLVRLSLGAALAALIAVEVISRRRVPAALALTLALVASFQVLAAVRAPDLEYGLRELANWTLYLPVALLAWSLPRLLLLASTALLSGVVIAFGAVLQLVGVLGGTWGVPSDTGESLTRLTSFLQNPNDFGMAMALSAIVAVALALTSHGRMRVLLVGLVCLFAIGVVGSTSRGSLAALVVGCVAVAAIFAFSHRVGGRLPRRAATPVLLIGLVVGVVAVGSMARDFRHSIVGSAIHGDASGQARLDRWSVLLSGPVAPAFGRGYGGFAEALDRDPPELLLNPGAEEGLLGWAPLSAGAVMRRVSAPVHSGNWAVELRRTESGARIAIGGGRSSAVPSRRYRFSVALNPSSAPVTASLSVNWQERASARTVEDRGGRRVFAGSRWQVIDGTFTAPPTAEFAIPVVTVMSSGPLRLYLDSARLRRLDPVFAGPEPPIWALRRELTVDNSFLRLFLEQGVAGVLALLASFLVAVFSRPSVPLAAMVTKALPVIVLGMLSVRALTADILSLPLWAFLTWLSIGLVAAITPVPKR